MHAMEDSGSFAPNASQVKQVAIGSSKETFQDLSEFIRERVHCTRQCYKHFGATHYYADFGEGIALLKYLCGSLVNLRVDEVVAGTAAGGWAAKNTKHI